MAMKSEEKVAKENRLRVFRVDGVRALEDATNEAIAVRKNMARLRELRLAKEAEAAAIGETEVKPARKRKRD
jgi:hypothetical protein